MGVFIELSATKRWIFWNRASSMTLVGATCYVLELIWLAEN